MLKHELDLPLVTTFHTLTHVKAEAGIDDDHADRARVEEEIVRCADGLVASTADERDQLVRAYDADPDRVEIVPPASTTRAFSPGDRAAAASAASRLADRPTLLFVGRIQPLKGVDVAVADAGRAGRRRGPAS